MKSPRDQEESAGAGEPQTKRVRISLSAYTLVEYTEVIEVPVDATEDTLDKLVRDRYTAVDGGEFQSSPHYWEKGDCRWVDAEPGAEPELRLVSEPESPGGFCLEEVEVENAANGPQEPA